MASDRIPIGEPPLYVWEVYEPDQEAWNTIGAILFVSDPLPLVTRSERIANDVFRGIAIKHGEAEGKDVRLAEYRPHWAHESIRYVG